MHRRGTEELERDREVKAGLRLREGLKSERLTLEWEMVGRGSEERQTPRPGSGTSLQVAELGTGMRGGGHTVV